uniref:C10 family peptidase n=1 Tax=Alloprevotella sp. TaxID=1872471 RepID=UPI004027B492
MIKAHYPLSIITQLLLVIALLISVPLTADATPIDYSRAAKIAQKYITLPNGKNFKAQVSQRHSNSDTPYYIFNDAHGRGFVIVAGNDVMGEILAYSTENTLDTLNANPCVKWLLEGYRQTYDDVKDEKVAASQASPRAATFLQTVSPLLKTKWGQSHPFNAQTGYPYSGCVATAVAQMMYYYQWPTHGLGKNEYTVTYDQTTKSADFSQSYYDWDNMLLDYRYPVRATTIQENAVAQLMSDVGIASSMQYTPSSSGTQGIFAYQALQKHFDYTAAYVTRAIEGPSRFASILRQELLNGCPVYLEGRPANTASGHAWVADGFDENGLFHMNFGWDGQGDAYYSLTNLSLSQTVSEFQCKPLGFYRGV